MATVLHDPVLVLLARAAFALLFASAAWHKLRDRGAFAGVLAAYRVVPDRLVRIAATTVAGLEVGAALAWVLPGAAGPAASVSVALFAVYSIAIAINLGRGRRAIDCGCGIAGARQPIGEGLLVRNLVLAGAALATLTPSASRTLAWVDVLTVAAGLAVAASIWTAAHGLAAASHRVRTVGAAR